MRNKGWNYYKNKNPKISATHKCLPDGYDMFPDFYQVKIAELNEQTKKGILYLQ